MKVKPDSENLIANYNPLRVVAMALLVIAFIVSVYIGITTSDEHVMLVLGAGIGVIVYTILTLVFATGV